MFPPVYRLSALTGMCGTSEEDDSADASDSSGEPTVDFEIFDPVAGDAPGIEPLLLRFLGEAGADHCQVWRCSPAVPPGPCLGDPGWLAGKIMRGAA
jgi:hypothetical protein